jgi:endonuclease G
MMECRLGFLAATVALFLGLAAPLVGQDLSEAESRLVSEHVYGGLPSEDRIYVRQAYVMAYDASRRVPKWVAYHIKPDYRNTPPRKGRFSSFRKDADVPDGVVDSDYTGLKEERGFARGHLAPYGIAGGDRDGDGAYAVKNVDGKVVPDDEDDVLTVYQINYMSNIAPQHHDAFNGSGGLWFKLERWIQDDLVTKRELDVWVFAGCVYGSAEMERVGPAGDISVPPMFYKVVIREPEQVGGSPRVLAFLFPHQRAKHGDIEDFLVPIDVIEAMTGLDFFRELRLGDEEKRKLEDTDTWDFWDDF